MPSNDRRVIVALDFADPAPAFDLLDRIDPLQCRVKIGKEMFTRAGPDFVTQVAGVVSMSFSTSSITTSRIPWLRPAPRRPTSVCGC